MKAIRKLNPNNIMVSYTLPFYSAWFESRYPVSIEFKEDYISALRMALEAFRAGNVGVTVSQYRETLHNHSEIARASSVLSPYPTDEELAEQVHHVSTNVSSKVDTYTLENVSIPLVWASL